MEKKNVVLLTVIAVATLLTAMVGSTFAFFTAQVNGTGNDTEIVEASTATVSATYTDGSAINVSDIAPGWSGSKEISIENTSSVAIDYTISFATYTNGFASLEYKLEDVEGANNDSAGNNIVGKQATFTAMGTDNLTGSNNTLVTGHLAAGETHKFKLTIQLKETNEDQTTSDGNKTFTGKLAAEAKASKVGA